MSNIFTIGGPPTGLFGSKFFQRRPDEEYLRRQIRFAHLLDEDIRAIAAGRDRSWERMRASWL